MEAEWLDTRTLKGDWDEEQFADALLAMKVKPNEEDIAARILKNLQQASVLYDVLSLIAAKRTEKI